MQRQLDGLSTRFEASTATVADLWQTRARRAAAHQRGAVAATCALRSTSFAADLRAALGTRWWTASSARLESTRSASVSDTLERAPWRSRQRVSEQLSEATRRAPWQRLAATFEQHSRFAAAHGGRRRTRACRREIGSRDEQRLARLDPGAGGHGRLAAAGMAAGGRAHRAASSRTICRTLAETARDISAQTEAHAKSTIAEIARLVQAASEAPRAAAEVIAELRQKLSDSMARDNAMLEERSRILETLDTLLDAVNHASTEQRGAIDALVAASADLLERVGTRFNDTGRAPKPARWPRSPPRSPAAPSRWRAWARPSASAVQLFSQSNDKLAAHLQRIEGALEQVDRAQRRAAGLLRGAGARGDRPEHHCRRSRSSKTCSTSPASARAAGSEA